MTDQKLRSCFEACRRRGFPRSETMRFCSHALASASFARGVDANEVLSWVDSTALADSAVALGVVSVSFQVAPVRLEEGGYVALCGIVERLLQAGGDARSVVLDASFVRPFADGVGKSRPRLRGLLRAVASAGIEDEFVRDCCAFADVASWHVLRLASQGIDTAETQECLAFLARLASAAAWRSYLLPWTGDLVRHAHRAVDMAELALAMLTGAGVALVVHLHRTRQLSHLVTTAEARARAGEAQWASCCARLCSVWPAQFYACSGREAEGDDEGTSVHTCPISLARCRRPARASDGFVYERDSIMRVLASAHRPVSPMTREPLLLVLLDVT